MADDDIVDGFSFLEGPHVKKIQDRDNKRPCVFCHRPDIDELNLGPMYLYNEMASHYFCVLFSAGLSQEGNDKEGVLGFLSEDIRKEVRRGNRLKCSYCHKNTATVGCCVSRCPAKFHFPCGLENKANYQFIDRYESFCMNHSKVKSVNLEDSDRKCPICLSEIEKPETAVVSTCCKSAVFHKRCVQKVSLCAGYFFKCPTCNSDTDFRLQMKEQGIFVPEQDAAWEREPNAFEELLETYNHCDADSCLCPKGRTYVAAKGQWLMARCRICGSAGTHRQCGGLNTIANWACALCLEVEVRTEKERERKEKERKEQAKKLKAVASKEKPKEKEPKAVIKEVTSAEAQSADKVKPTKSTNRAKKSGRKIELPKDGDDQDGEEVNLGQLLIMPCCRDFFPHSRPQMQMFAKRYNVIPDWRMNVLQVNLVDVFKPPPVSNEVENVPKKPKKALANRDVNSVVPKDSRPTKTRKPKKPKSKRSSRKKSSWNKGVIPKRSQSSKKAKSGDQKGPMDNFVFKVPKIPSPDKSEQNRETASTKTQESTNDKTGAAASTNAVLAGIHKSQNFARWVSQNSAPAENGVKKSQEQVVPEKGSCDPVATSAKNGDDEGVIEENRKRKLEDESKEGGESRKRNNAFEVALATSKPKRGALPL